MKSKTIVTVFLISFIVASCAPAPKAVPTEPTSPTSTFTPNPISTPSATATSTAIPVFTDIACEPMSNPFLENNKPKNEYFLGYPPNPSISRICSFEGTISRGQYYKHEIMKDLVFCLIPSSSTKTPNEGWYIIISDTQKGGCSESFDNFSPIITPPLYNPSFNVYGWQFRNKDNTGKNDGSVNEPQEERVINFLFNREAFTAAQNNFNCTHYNSEPDCLLATQTANTEVTWSVARFTITELELGNLIPNSLAWVESMKFKFEALLPPE